MRNLYAGQEATIRTGHGTTDWFQTGKGVCQGCILSPCLFNLYAYFFMLLLLLSRFSHVRLCVTHRQQLIWVPGPWDSPGKNTGVGCHFLLQCRKVKSEREVGQLCPTLCDLRDSSPPGSPVPGILQARTLEWVAISFSNA